MKHVYAIIVIFSLTLLMAQTTITPSWSGVETQQLLANCQLHNSDSVVCVATDGVAFSYQGAAFVKQNLQGPAGPQGPVGATGATGATGPQGPPGPVQGFGSAKCPTFSFAGSPTTSSIQLGPGCTETTP